jgi:hypothetical protein
MCDRAQLIAGGSAEVGVQSQYLDSELHLVDDTLSGAMAAVKQFEVFDSVVGSDTVDVVDGLVGGQVAPDVLRHDVSMFGHIARAFFSILRRNDDSDITVSSGSLGDFLVRVSSPVGKPAKKRATFGAAKQFFSVERAAGSALNSHRLLALFAGYGPFISGKSPRGTSAFGGAVHRVFVVLLAILIQIRGLVTKDRVTNTAVEVGRGFLRSRTSVYCFVRGLASKTAKPLIAVGRFDRKNGRALFTSLFDGHFVFSMFAAMGVGNTDACLSK